MNNIETLLEGVPGIKLIRTDTTVQIGAIVAKKLEGRRRKVEGMERVYIEVRIGAKMVSRRH